MKCALAELSRRNVFRVAAAYIIVGWILLQVASIEAPAMNLPGWAISFVLYVLIIGSSLSNWEPRTNKESASSLHRLAFLKATNLMGGDERKHWKKSASISGFIEKHI